VFVDSYATVPHDSIRRLMALHVAGKLTVTQLDDRMRIDTWSATGATLIDGQNRVHFPAFIEATGQQVSGAKDFPFPSLLRQGVIQDVNTDTISEATRGIAVDGDYHPTSAFQSSQRLFCLSLPFLLGQHPFAQGITSSAEMADVVANAIQAAQTHPSSMSEEEIPQRARAGETSGNHFASIDDWKATGEHVGLGQSLKLGSPP
jgi:hypothetical protein